MSRSDTSVEEEDFEPGEEEDQGPPWPGKYIGCRNDQKERHGRGWAILPNGDQYDGQYRHGRRHGIGLYVFKGGARYYGYYRCGHRSGRGMFIYPDGTMFEGCWRHNVKHGRGRYQYVNGDTYTGAWYRGLRHGVGVYVYKAEEDCPPIRFKGTWMQGVRVGPFELSIGNDETCTVLQGTWDNMYPKGPSVFSFNQQYLLMGFFQSWRDFDMEKQEEEGMEEAEPIAGLNEMGESEGNEMYPQEMSLWFAQDICKYDYCLLPQQPVPLPLSDSELSICSLSTVPTVPSVCELPPFDGEGEEEGECECIPCECDECSLTDFDMGSEPCGPKADPCAIEIKPEPTCP